MFMCTAASRVQTDPWGLPASSLCYGDASMDHKERETLGRLHRECTAALGKLFKKGEEMCRVLSAIENHPASGEQRRAVMEQRVKENAAHTAYDSARQALFKRAGWDS
jgi:hypothetical protein